MTLEKTRDRAARSIDPATHYDSPAALADDERLPVGRRLELLRRWAYDVRERLVATGEGMDGPGEAADLSAIASAIDRLAPPEARTDTAVPTRHGSVAGAGEPDRAARLPNAFIPFGPGAGVPALRQRDRRVSSGALVLVVGVVVALSLIAVFVQGPVAFLLGGGVLALLVVVLLGARTRSRSHADGPGADGRSSR